MKPLLVSSCHRLEFFGTFRSKKQNPPRDSKVRCTQKKQKKQKEIAKITKGTTLKKPSSLKKDDYD